mmetsp:Transcript_5559/g.14065  ORF Transcript_5559/g.14065 Transcript_5559/m.14065 type:complete len:350 (-) Transcript_5559:238-1287(-)
MGACGSSVAPSTDANKDIDSQLRNEKRGQKKEVKMLILGAGDSGKSTVAKQFRLINGVNFTEQERQLHLKVILANIVESAKLLVKICHCRNYELKNDEQEAAEHFLTFSLLGDQLITTDNLKRLKLLWASDAFKRAVERGSEYSLPGCTTYLFESLDRIFADGYLPNDDDIVRCRQRTIGIIETMFQFRGHTFRMVDVGGQRSERRRWFQVFDGVNCVIFCAPLNEYDLYLEESKETNRMMESLRLFEEISQMHIFAQSSIIVFLNKSDLLADKIGKTDLSVLFPQYKGGSNAEEATNFIRNMYKSIANDSKPFYSHVTCAINHSNAKAVWTVISDTLLRGRMEEAGVM